MEWVVVGILTIVWGAQIPKRPLLVLYTKRIFLTLVIVLVLFLMYSTRQQFNTWSADSVAQYLLPPFQAIDYFLLYVLFRVWMPFMISAAVTALFLWWAHRYNRRHEGKVFYSDELWVVASAILLMSWPGLVVYVLVMVVLFTTVSLSIQAVKGRDFRVSPYYFWIPAALFAILISELWLEHMPVWSLLVI
jgi:hypothetical protein